MIPSTVTVIVVNWNGGTFLDECLGRLMQQSLLPARILVMDNGSTDGSAERAQQVPGVTVRMLGANLGFAVANNRALDECDTNLVALLNPDAFPDTDWLMRLVSAARTYPDVAVFGSRQMIHGLPATLDGVGDVYHISGLVWRDGYNRAQCEADNVVGEIFSPCACAALYRRDALVRAGGFDEDYFCYVEDIDLGFRLRLAGYTCLYVPDAVVHHVGSASSGGKHSYFSVYHGHRNLVWTFIKNMPGVLFWALLPLHIFLNLVTVACFSMRGQGKVILRSKRDAIKGIPRMWRKRCNIQTSRRASIMDIWRVLDKRLSYQGKTTILNDEGIR
jgi:GT2 family glycosyltransferase